MASTSRSVCSHQGGSRLASASAYLPAVSSSWVDQRTQLTGQAGHARGGQLAGIPRADGGDVGGIDRGSTARSRGLRPALNRPSVSPSSQSAASPVGEIRGGQASSCPSTNSKPGRSASACKAASASRITGQSPPISSGNRPRPGRRRPPAPRARSSLPGPPRPAGRTGRAPGREPGSARSPVSVTPGCRASAVARPRWRNTAGARATPSTVPLELAGTPIRASPAGVTR